MLTSFNHFERKLMQFFFSAWLFEGEVYAIFLPHLSSSPNF